MAMKIRLAERMGAVHERTYENIHMGQDMLFRHPSPAEVVSLSKPPTLYRRNTDVQNWGKS